MTPTEKIAHLNDEARKGLLPGSTKVLLTPLVTALPEPLLLHLQDAVSQFDAFTEDTDPYGERDFGSGIRRSPSRSLGRILGSPARRRVREAQVSHVGKETQRLTNPHQTRE